MLATVSATIERPVLMTCCVRTQPLPHGVSGVGGVTTITAWDATGEILEELASPVVLSMATEVCHGST